MRVPPDDDDLIKPPSHGPLFEQPPEPPKPPPPPPPEPPDALDIAEAKGFRKPPYHHGVPGEPTSKLAAEEVAPRAASDRRLVYECHKAHPDGLTDFELAEELHGLQTSFGMRRGELVYANLIEASDLRRLPRPGARTPAIVWRIVQPVTPTDEAMAIVQAVMAERARLKKAEEDAA